MGEITSAEDVLKILKEVGSSVELGPDDDFTEAGVDSFDTTKLADEISARTEIKFDVTEMFQLSSASKIADAIGKRKADPNWVPEGAPPRDPDAAPAAPAAPVSVPKAVDPYAKPIEHHDYDLSSIKGLFEKLGIEQYAAAFDDEGYDDPETIKALSKEELDELIECARSHAWPCVHAARPSARAAARLSPLRSDQDEKGPRAQADHVARRRPQGLTAWAGAHACARGTCVTTYWPGRWGCARA